MKVINLYGGPGISKSTTAAGLFYKMKQTGYKCELITEYAKDVVYQESFFKLKDQGYIFIKQHHKIWRLKDKIDYAIVDSPLPLSLHYFADGDVYDREAFSDFVISTFHNYDNLNILIKRNDSYPYQEYGRTQTYEEAKAVDLSIKNLLNKFHIQHYEYEASSELVDIILNNHICGVLISSF